MTSSPQRQASLIARIVLKASTTLLLLRSLIVLAMAPKGRA